MARTTYHVEILSNRVSGNTYYVGPFASRAEAAAWADELPRMPEWRVGRVLPWGQVRRARWCSEQILQVCKPTEENLEIAIVEALSDASSPPLPYVVYDQA